MSVFIYIIKVIIVCFVLVSFSCKKVTDEQDPVIIIDLPEENKNINIPDTLHIKAVVSDDNKLESIQIVITDEYFIPAFNSYSYPVDGNPTKIEDHLVLDDILIESGIYFLKIRASDGVNTKNAYRKIYVNGVPRELNNVIIITKNAGDIVVQSVDNTFSLNHLFTVNGSYETSEINSRHQLLYIAGSYSDHLRAFNLMNYDQEWIIEGENHPPLPYFRNLLYDDDLLFVSTSKGEIRWYNEHKVNLSSAVMDGKMVPGLCCLHGEFIVTESSEISGVHKYLLSFYLVSGSPANKLLVDMDIAGIFPKEENKLYVPGNKLNEGGLYIYNTQTNGIEKIRQFDGKKIIASESVDKNNLFIAFGDGVYLYTYNLNSLTLFIPALSAQIMRFDAIGSILYIAESMRVSSYKYPQGYLIDNVDMPKEIMNMHLHYNK